MHHSLHWLSSSFHSWVIHRSMAVLNCLDTLTTREKVRTDKDTNRQTRYPNINGQLAIKHLLRWSTAHTNTNNHMSPLPWTLIKHNPRAGAERLMLKHQLLAEAYSMVVVFFVCFFGFECLSSIYLFSLRSKIQFVRKFRECWDSNPGRLGEKRERYLYAMPSPQG